MPACRSTSWPIGVPGYNAIAVFETFAISKVRQPRYKGCIQGAVSITMNIRATEDLVNIWPETSNGSFIY